MVYEGSGLEFVVLWVVVTWLILFSAVLVALRLRNRPPDLSQLRECPQCAELIKRAAKVCRYCGRESEPMVMREGRWWSTDSSGRPVWFDSATGSWRTEG